MNTRARLRLTSVHRARALSGAYGRTSVRHASLRIRHAFSTHCPRARPLVNTVAADSYLPLLVLCDVAARRLGTFRYPLCP